MLVSIYTFVHTIHETGFPKILYQAFSKGPEHFLIPIFLQPDGVNLLCFKLFQFDLAEFIV